MAWNWLIDFKVFNPFPHNDTFWQVWERSLSKTLWEKEKLLVQAIPPFPTMFSTLSNIETIIFVTFNLLSANAFSLVWSKILLRGNGLMLFSAVFQLHWGGQCTYPCFPGLFLTINLHNIFSPSHWLLSHITFVETIDTGDRGINPVAMTIINARKAYRPSLGIEPATSCPQVLYATDWAMGLSRRHGKGKMCCRSVSQCLWTLLTLPNDKSLEWSKLKAFADDKINLT